MPSLEEIIKQRLVEATEQVQESKNVKDIKDSDVNAVKDDPENKGTEDKIIANPKNKPVVKEEKVSDIEQKEVVAEVKANTESEQKDSVSAQVSALLEAEGLSDEFKLQAVTIFEAAVADRVLQIEEAMKTEFDAQLAEAKEQMNTDIDEFLSEAVSQWQKENEVAIKSNFNTQVNESFMDGLMALIKEHSIEVPEGKEDAFAAALTEVETLKEASVEHEKTVASLQEQINTLEGKAILESYRSKMTVVEFDRFVQLVESVKYNSREQYEKQLNIVLENFGQKKTEAKPIVENKQVEIPQQALVVEKVEDTRMAQYVKALKQ